MRLATVLLFAFLIVVICSTDKFTRVKRHFYSLTDVIVNRHQHQFDFSSRSCGKKCQEVLEENIRSSTGKGYNGFDSPFAMLNDGFEDVGIETICGEFENSKNCFAECDRPSGSVGYYRFIYVINHFPCYQRAKNEVTNECIKKCSSSSFIKALATAKNSAANTTANVLRQLDALRPLCKFMNCAVDCARLIFDKQCTDDPKAGSFFREIAIAGQRTTLSEMEALDAELGTNLMPQECFDSMSPNICPCPLLNSILVKSPESKKGALVSLLNGVVSYPTDLDVNSCFTAISCTLPKGLPPTIVFRGVLNHRSVHGHMNRPRVQALNCDKASGAWMLPPDVNVSAQPFVQFACLSIRMEIAYIFPAAATDSTTT
uniref:Uncharacterized protein n=1 Tax=Plectus sambesii TaxID=2011161 RepID=A0A914XFE3_9BILA